MDVPIVGAGIGGLTLALELHDARHCLPRLSRRRRRSRRSASASTSCRTHARSWAGSGFRTRSRRVAVTTQRVGVLQPLRPAHLPRAARTARRLRRRRSSRSIAATCRWCCSMRSSSGWAPTRIVAGPPLHRRRRRTSAASPCISRSATRRALPPVRADASSSPATASIPSMRKQFYPDEGEPRYSGINMWRGVTRWQPFLSRREHGAGRLARQRQDGHLPDPRRRSTRRAASWSTGWPKSRRRARSTARLEPAAASSTTSSARSRTGTSTGSTCRR